MDDLYFLLDARSRAARDSFVRSDAVWLRTFESLDLNGFQVKTVETFHSSRLDSSSCHVCQRPLQSIEQLSGTDDKVQRPSKWFQSLEKLEEKRKWRRTSTKLTESYEKWLKMCRSVRGQATCLEASLSDSRKEDQSRTGTTITTSRTEEATIVGQAHELSFESNATERIDTIQEKVPLTVSGGERIAVISESEEIVTTSTEMRTSRPRSTERESSRALAFPQEVPRTPERQAHISLLSVGESASTVSTSATFRSSRYLNDTPDTPESLLERGKSSTRNLGPESPSLRKSVALDGGLGRLAVPERFQTDPLPDGTFDYQGPCHERRSRSRPKLGHFRSKRPSDASDLTVSDPAHITPASQQKTDWFVKTFKGEETRIDHSKVKEEDIKAQITTTTEQEEINVFQFHDDLFEELTTRVKRVRVTETTVPLASPTSKGQPQYHSDEKIDRQLQSVNALQVYDSVVNARTWEMFNAGVHTCYADTKKGERCRRGLKSDEAAIKRVLRKLEANSDPRGQLHGAYKLVRELLHLILCPHNHQANSEHILSRFQARLDPMFSAERSQITSIETFSSKSEKIVLSGHSGFELWQPRRAAKLAVSARLMEVVSNNLSPLETKPGYLYVYRVQEVFGFVKIGFTTKSVEVRLKGWQRQCRHKPQALLRSCESVLYAKRLEALVHAELKDSRFRQMQCVCGKKHREWFSVSEPDVQTIIDRWSAWIKTDPYEENSALKEEHRRGLHALCEPTVLSACVPKDLQPAREHSERPVGGFDFPGRASTFPMEEWGKTEMGNLVGLGL